MDDTFGNISLSVNCEDVCFSAKYRLITTINHVGSLSSGHYWVYIRDLVKDICYLCDDESVKRVSSTSLNNSSSYLLFYQRK